MHGNVWEWCWNDRGLKQAARGGGFRNDPSYCRSAYRSAYLPGSRNNSIGFRPVLAPISPSAVKPTDLSGRWIDLNGGSIEIEQTGTGLIAKGLDERVTKWWWTKGEGELAGRMIRMKHFQGDVLGDEQTVRVSQDSSRIHWANDTYWRRQQKE